MVRPDGTKWSLHQDICAAKETIARIRQMEQDYGVHIALAHDASWMLHEEENPVLFSLLDEDFVKDIRENVVQGKPF